MAPRILVIDVETRPALVHVWGLKNQFVSLNQVMDPGGMLCFAAKWYGEPKMFFHRGKDMVKAAWKLLDEAEVVVHFNGTTFDVPHLNRMFLEAGLGPPSPFKQIDLWKTCATRFRFLSSKLAHVSEQLGIGHKIHHEGHSLWVKCMAGDEKAWAKMKSYNRGDVALTERLYDALRPWIPNHPHLGLYAQDATSKPACPRCGAQPMERRGFGYTTVSRYQRWFCKGCGGWARGTDHKGRVSTRVLL